MNTVNGQISINTKTQEQINKLTGAVNKVISITNPKQINADHLYLKNVIKIGYMNSIITDLLEVSIVKVLLDNKQLHFIIKYPKPSLECKKIIIFPV